MSKPPDTQEETHVAVESYSVVRVSSGMSGLAYADDGSECRVGWAGMTDDDLTWYFDGNEWEYRRGRKAAKPAEES